MIFPWYVVWWRSGFLACFLSSYIYTQRCMHLYINMNTFIFIHTHQELDLHTSTQIPPKADTSDKGQDDLNEEGDNSGKGEVDLREGDREDRIK